jgi:hypothetical protein
MSTIRFYIQHLADGAITDDETCLLDPDRTVEEIRKGFCILGKKMEFVLEFDPPLVVPAPAEDGLELER